MTDPYEMVFLDIETTPLIGYSWRVWDTSLIKVARDWHILSFAYKFRGDKTVKVVALPDFPKTYKKDSTDDSELAKALWEIFDKANCIVAHNGDKFDIPKIKSRLLVNGLPPPSPFTSVDTCAIAKRQFAFTSNKLGDLGELLGLGKKEDTGGFDLWLGCMGRDEPSWKVMRKYNKQDVVLLEKVYDKLKAWSPSHPNVNLGKPREKRLCPVCGSDKVQKRGLRYYKNYRVQQYACQAPGCCAWSKGERDNSIVGVVKPLT